MESISLEDSRSSWRLLYQIGASAALFSVVIIPIQLVLFVVSPPPTTVAGFFALFERSTLMGLLSLDLLYLINNALGLILFPALYVSLRHINKSIMLIALVVGIAGSASFFASDPVINMLHLYKQYSTAVTDVQKSAYVAAGEAMLAIYSGTAYHMHYILGSLSLFSISVVMLKSRSYGKATAVIGITTNVVAMGLYIPVFGSYISAFSALGYGIWFTMVALAFLRMAREEDRGNEKRV